MTNYNGPYKDKIIKYLDYRKNVLHQNLHPLNIYLKLFDDYTIKNNITTLSKGNIENWLILRENENRNTLRLRAYTIKCFVKYLKIMDIDDNSYIVDSKIYQCKSTYVPYIFMKTEVEELINQIDNLKLNTDKIQYKLFFKILYCTGMRDSELIKLKLKNINLEEKKLLVENSKFGIDRYIFIDDSLYNDIKIYLDNYHNKISKYLFYTINNNKRNIQQMQIVFHRAINNSNRFNKNIRYRVHDLRHTFAVYNIKKAYDRSEDIYAFLPILMTYMGHSDIKSTEYYLRFTPDIYEKVINQFETKYDNIFPKINKEINDE